jgi:hypothetical protein
MGGGLESRCVVRVYVADGVVRLVFLSWGVVRVDVQLKRGCGSPGLCSEISFFPWWRDCM